MKQGDLHFSGRANLGQCRTVLEAGNQFNGLPQQRDRVLTNAAALDVVLGRRSWVQKSAGWQADEMHELYESMLHIPSANRIPPMKICDHLCHARARQGWAETLLTLNVQLKPDSHKQLLLIGV